MCAGIVFVWVFVVEVINVRYTGSGNVKLITSNLKLCKEIDVNFHRLIARKCGGLKKNNCKPMNFNIVLSYYHHSI